MDSNVSNEELVQLLSGCLKDHASLYRIVFSRPLQGRKAAISKVTIRPVRVRGSTQFQFSSYDDRKSIVKNHEIAQALEETKQVLQGGFRSISVLTSDSTIQVERRDGLIRLSKGKAQVGAERLDHAHDRKKNRLVMPDNAAETLATLGFLTGGGDIKPTMQKKYRQVNEFIRIMAETTFLQAAEPEILDIVDCGCGNAYLTFALYHYLTAIRSKATRLVGIDTDDAAVARNNEKARQLGFADLRFLQHTISGYTPETLPGAVLSLHACDTATDQAIANGIRWKSRLILCAPCCHHHLNHQLKSGNDSLIARSLSRHGLLLEKLGDAMTDAFRVQILSLVGYSVSCVKLVDPENTERNLLIRAEWTGRRGTEQEMARYHELKGLLHVRPYLEEILGNELAP